MSEYFDYFQKLEELDEAKLVDELQKLNTKLYSIKKDGPIRQQIQGMLEAAQDKYNTLVQTRIYDNKNKDKSETIDIGEIEEVVYTPDYTEKELITYFSRFYSGEETESVTKKAEAKPMPKPSPKFTPPIITPADRPIQTSGSVEVGNVPKFGS